MKYLHLWCALLALCAVTVLGCQAKPVPGPDGLAERITAYKSYTRARSSWPTKTWPVAKPASVGFDEKALDKAMKYAFTMTGDEKNRKGVRTDGVVIIRHGKLVYERYARGYKKTTPHLSWSVSKSFTNGLVGIAVHKGLMKIDEPAAKYVKTLDRGQHKQILIRHLLNQTDGIDWNEGHEPSPIDSKVIMMLYTAGRGNMGLFTAKQPLKYVPGTRWYYSSGTTNLLMLTLRNALKAKKRTLEDFAWGELFDKIGMSSVTWERDGAGTFVGSSYVYATPRDLAKYGYLFLNNGVWEGKRLVGKDWVKFSTTASKANVKGHYGAQWWLNLGRPERKQKRRFPSVPRELFYAGGHWGQGIFVFPSLDLVIVRTADDRDKTFYRGRFLRLILDSLQAEKKSKTVPKKVTPKAETQQVKDAKDTPKVEKATQKTAPVKDKKGAKR